jgi:hypothetical protein
MLPDFPEFKTYARAKLLEWMKQQVPAIAPILGEIRHFSQHEGNRGFLTRADQSADPMEQAVAHVQFEIRREEMKAFDLDALQQKLLAMAEQIADQQSSTLFRTVAQAAESVGNTVDARGNFKQEDFLELLRKVELEFDPATGEIAPGFAFVMHPDTAKSVVERVNEWEKDPNFIIAHEALMKKKKEEWIDRENRRTLVD